MSDDGRPALSRWRARFRELDACPWPGPRPLRSDDQALLVGRNKSRQEFRRAIKQHRLILLHGPSGVGKTSLLQAGLVPDLERSGAMVFSTDQWGGEHRTDVRLFLADRLRLPEVVGGDVFDALDASLSDRAILVLDQFEELVRYSPVMAEHVFDQILDLNRRLRFKIVISFRSEYLHEFATLEDNAVNFSVTKFPLRELEDDAAEKVILAGNKSRPGAIDEDTAKSLAVEWSKARSLGRQEVALDDPFGRVGLLHLQAMLYALHFANKAQTLSEEAISAILAAERRDAGITRDGIDANAFRFALQRAIDFKLEHCEAASRSDNRDLHLDEFLSEGTRWMLARTVTHLSSAGYKLIRGAHELAHLALGGDYDALRDGLDMRHNRVSSDQERALFEAVLASAGVGERHDGESATPGADLLSVSRDDIAADADRRLLHADAVDSWSSRLDSGSTSFENDPLGVTCGPMMGLTPADVLIEELRRFALALVWLDTSSLVRVTTPIGTGAMVSLIHDGFGAALIRWAERVSGDPSGPLNAITAPRGASFAWSPGPAMIGQSRTPAVTGRTEELGYRLIPNLRWRGGWVQADLDRIAFLNCDFRGTLFDGCRMSGVTFVNCLLDGAIFSDCLFSGRQAGVADEEGWSDAEPDFVVAAPSSLIQAHARQRRFGPQAEAAFLCCLPGAPAVPFRGEQTSTLVRFPDPGMPAESRRLDVHLDGGGVAVYGGRISSLVLRKCYLEENSGITLRHTTGSGLEIVEVEDSPGRFEIYGSALRHITVSPQVSAKADARVQVMASESTLAQIWVGSRLRGAVTVAGSRLIHAWNGSPSSEGVNGVTFTAIGCSVHGLLDVVVERCTEVGDGPQTGRAVDLGLPGLNDQLHRMDYRRNPARVQRHLPPMRRDT